MAGGCGGDDGAATEPSVDTAGYDLTVEVEAGELAFTRDAYSASAGEISVAYVGTDGILHTLLVEDNDDLRLQVNTDGAVDTGTITLDAGDYTLVCDIGGHREGGMVAELTVE